MELDRNLAGNRDKARFQLKDKRRMTMDSLFGSIEIPKNYYYDRETEKYVSLLDRYLQQATGKPIYHVLKALQGF